MLIKIATPISRLFLGGEEVLIKKVIAMSGALEIRDISPKIFSLLPGLYHSDLSIVKEWTDEEFEKAVSVIKKNNVILISLHVASCFSYASVKNGIFQPVGRRMSADEMLKNTKKNVNLLRNKVKNVKIAIENNNYFPSGAYELVTEAPFINKILADNNLGLLLDLGHAKITAKHRSLRLNEYLKKLDLSRVYQIHLSGVGRLNNFYQDAHMELTTEDWRRFKNMIDICSSLKYVTIEYYKNLPKLILMLSKLRTILYGKNTNFAGSKN